MPLISLLSAALIMVAVASLLFAGIGDFCGSYDDNTVAQVKDAVSSAVAQCYALEGAYPPDLGYLEHNYGLQLNRDKYIYHYELFASNILPDVQVFVKERAGE